MSKTIKALFNAIVVKPLEEEEQKYGNIIVPDLGKEKSLVCKVITVGPGHYSVTGTFIPTTVKQDDIVILPPQGPTKIYFENEEYYTCAENLVCAIIEETNK
jgi:chaperonin GroES